LEQVEYGAADAPVWCALPLIGHAIPNAPTDPPAHFLLHAGEGIASGTACDCGRYFPGGPKGHLATMLESVRVHSVDSFRGSEVDCVLVSFVRSNSAMRVGFLKGFQRLNVAGRKRFLLMALLCFE